MEILGNAFMPKLCPKFYCQNCDYGTCKKSSYMNHLSSDKHSVSVIGNKKEQNGNAIMPKLCSEKIACQNCNREFQTSSGLWKHKKKCNLQDNKVNLEDKKLNEVDKDELIITLLKQNAKLMEILENGTHNTTNNTTTHTNSHNKAFNLNFFLNETCKNAMNITDFVDSIKLQLNDLIEVGEIGYVEGISKIIVKNLNNLDETIRPVHCTDKKRETMYVKDQGEWNKEDEKKTKLTKAIKRIADKNIRLLPAFREQYPEYKNSSSKVSDKYDKMVIEVMTTDEDKNEKIIKNISKVTTIR
jgi:hypothetical protein